MSIKMAMFSMQRASIAMFMALLVQGCATTSPADSTIEINPKQSFGNYLRTGDRFMRNGDTESALVQYFLALDLDSKNTTALYKVGNTHRLMNNPDSAKESYRQVLDLDPNHLDSREGLALLNLQEENISYARILLESVLKSDPNRWESKNALGIIHDLEQEYDQAQSFYLSAISLKPESAKIHNNLGYSFYLQGELEKALSQFELVVNTFPNYKLGWSNLALVYMQMDEEEKAKLAFQKIVTEPQALNNIGYFDLLNNETADAGEKFKQALRLSPTFYSTAQQNLSSLESSDHTYSHSVAKRPKKRPKQSSAMHSLGKINSLIPTAERRGTTTLEASFRSKKPAGATVLSKRDKIMLKEHVFEAQEKLGELGYYDGNVDGKAGRNTLNAVRQYQRDNQMVVNGIINRTFLRAL